MSRARLMHIAMTVLQFMHLIWSQKFDLPSGQKLLHRKVGVVSTHQEQPIFKGKKLFRLQLSLLLDRANSVPFIYQTFELSDIRVQTSDVVLVMPLNRVELLTSNIIPVHL